MRNIDFGNYLYQLRKENNLTQRFVAYELNVTDKAVSKWEMGKSKPDLEKLKLLATLYNVPLNDLLNEDKKKEVKISKIVLTGGPCAGKTTALNWISNYFSKRGYTVLNVPETATELITNGVAPWTCETSYDYQTFQFRLQKIKEQIFDDAAKKMKNDKILIVCDRGILDNKAYMKNVEFKKILKEFGTSEIKERDSYDAVFHLVSAAKGKEKVYTLANNRTINGQNAKETEYQDVDDPYHKDVIIKVGTGTITLKNLSTDGDTQVHLINTAENDTAIVEVAKIHKISRSEATAENAFVNTIDEYIIKGNAVVNNVANSGDYATIDVSAGGENTIDNSGAND